MSLFLRKFRQAENSNQEQGLFGSGNEILKKKEEKLFLAAVFLWSLFLFFYLSRSLGLLSLWMDEGFHYIAAQKILEHGYPLYPSGHIYFKAILYTYFLSMFSLFGGLKAETLRLVSVLTSVVSVPVIYLFARRLFDRTTAFTSIVLFGLSVWVAEYSRAALYFSPLLFICILCLIFFYKGFFCENKKYKILASVFFMLAPLVHQLGMSVWFCFPAFFLVRGARRFFKKDILLSISLISLFYVFIQIHEYFFWDVGYVYEKTDSSFQGMLNYFFSSFSLSYFKELFRSFPAMSIVVLGGFFLFLGYYLASEKGAARSRNLFLKNWLFLNLCLIFPLIFLGFFRTHVQPRYLYHLYPLFLILFVVSLFQASCSLVQIILFCFDLKKEKVFRRISIFLFLVLLFLLVEGIGPGKVRSVVDRYYGDPVTTDIITRSGRFEHYDHKGPGEYVRHFLEDEDIVVAMHMVFQYIYAGRVDYWLWSGGPGTWDAWEKTRESWRDFYIGAKWINNINDLKRVIFDNPDRRIWLICSPSLYRRDHINREIYEFIIGHSKELVFQGKDGMSQVYLFNERENVLTGETQDMEGEWIPTSKGKTVFLDSASKKSVLFLEGKGEEIHFSFILPQNLSAGRHFFRLRAMVREKVAAEEKLLGISLRALNGKKVYATHYLTGNYLDKPGEFQERKWSFFMEKPGRVEFVFYFTGKASLWLDYIDVLDKSDEEQ